MDFDEKKLVLYVEDNPAHADLVRRQLSRERPDVEVAHFADGEAALTYLRQGARPALTLLDLRLPKIDGLDLLQRIRENPATSRLPVVILTTSGVASDMSTAYRNGANGYLIKPLDFAQLREMLASLCRFWLE